MEKDMEHPKGSVRHYPAIYEKIIPIALGVIVLIIIVLVVITFGVALGIWANPI